MVGSGETGRILTQVSRIYEKALEDLSAAYLRIAALTPLLAGARISAELERVLGRSAGNVLVIPAPLLYECFSELIKYGEKGKEWIVAIGAAELDGKLLAAGVHSIRCSKSSGTEAEVDYDHLSSMLRFYRTAGYRIAAIAHIHPWEADDVRPSARDIATQRRWEKLVDDIVGIVFSNSGVFRIFTAESGLNVEINGDGVEKLGENLYRLTRAGEVREWKKES